MVKILYDHQVFSISKYGGAARYITKLIQELSRQTPWDLKIYCGLYMNKFIIELNRKNKIGYFFPRLPKIDSVIRSIINDQLNSIYLNTTPPPDIYHQTLYKPIKVDSKTSIILTLYDLIHEKLNTIMRTSTNYHQDQIVDEKYKSIKNAKHIICISENTKNDLTDLYNVREDKISVIYLATDIDKYIVSKPPIDGPYLLYVGQRNGYKNFKNFIYAYANNLKINNEFKIVCFGQGTFKKEEYGIIKKIKNYNQKIIHIEGSDILLASLYKYATALIYPSFYEGFGLPLIEAMRLKCPVICSATNCFNEIARNSAKYFNPYEIESISSAIEKVIFSEKTLNQMKEIGYIQSNKYTWENTAIHTKEIYSKFL
jgi:glycosyltransferase involved in cell wall biosynthesis